MENMSRPDGLRIGVAILYVADSRALAATLAALARSFEAPAHTVILEQSSGSRALRPVTPPPGCDLVKVADWVNVRSAALDAFADCDLAVIIREGVILAPSALTVERERFEAQPDLNVVLSISRLHVGIDVFLKSKEQLDPYDKLRKIGDNRPLGASNYFSICVLTIALSRGPVGSFERFARRSDWGAARLYIDGLGETSKIIELQSDSFGSIGHYPDKRDGVRQGSEAAAELYRFQQAHPGYKETVKSEFRRLVYEQIRGVLKLSNAKARLKFLQGMFRGVRTNRMMEARLRRDIAELS